MTHAQYKEIVDVVTDSAVLRLAASEEHDSRVAFETRLMSLEAQVDALLSVVGQLVKPK